MTRLSDERLAQIRTMQRGSGFAFPAMAISDLLDHIDALEAERAEMPAIYAVQDWVDADGIHDGWRTSNGFFFSDRSHAEESLDYLAREHPNTEFRLAETRTTPWLSSTGDRR